MTKLVVAWIVEDDFDCWQLSYESVKDHADAFVLVNGNDSGDSENWEATYFEFKDTYHGYIQEGSAHSEGNTTEISSPYPHDDKGADGMQRNKYLDYLKEHHVGDWCLVLDADEFVDKPDEIRKTIEKLEALKCDACSPKMRHLVGDLSKEDAQYPEHFVPLRLFKVTEGLSYPEVEHGLLQGTKKYAYGSDFTIWHMGYAREVFRLHKKYKNHLAKSNIHDPQFLTQWYHAHLLGEFPVSKVNEADLPPVLRKFLDINDDYVYFRHRNLELKHWVDAYHWKEFFKPKNALEVGCGLGHRVHAMNAVGIDADGFDISEWAVTHTPYKELNGKLWAASVTDKKFSRDPSGRDLIVCYDVLEHIEPDKLDDVIDSLHCWTNKWVLVSVPFIGDSNLMNDSTHKIFWTRDQWIEAFAKHNLAAVPTPEHFLFKHQLIVLEKQ